MVLKRTRIPRQRFLHLTKQGSGCPALGLESYFYYDDDGGGQDCDGGDNINANSPFAIQNLSISGLLAKLHIKSGYQEHSIVNTICLMLPLKEAKKKGEAILLFVQ